jgi:glycosyltransferase involved in cell wall biosynthesis
MPSVKISVCIPTYNGAEFVANAIESILAQTFADFELLVVDDSSSDTTMDIVRSFPDPRMRICRNEKRLGIPGNWNRCLSLAQGEYICLFHQDDVMLPENLQRKVQVLASDTTIGFVHSAAKMLLEDSAPTVLDNWIEDTDHDFVTDGVTYFRKLFFHGNLICASAVVARCQLLLDLGGFDEQLSYTPDYEMWMKAAVEERVGFLHQPLVIYRWHGKNASHPYRFERGVEEMCLARGRALHYYVDHTGQREEGNLLQAALTVITESKRHAVQLEQYIESQGAYVKQLEQERDRLWAEVQRVGRSWEEQKSYIEQLEQQREQLWAEVQQAKRTWEEQRRYIEHLEQERDKLWAEVQQVGRTWEEQKGYIEHLEQERDKLWAEVQQVGRTWEEQKGYIEHLEQERDKLWAEVQQVGRTWEEQKGYIGHLEQERDKLWAEVQQVGRTWEEQKGYIGHLEQERDRLQAVYARVLSQRLRRLVRRVRLRTGTL